MAKELIACLQSEVLGDPESDCGSQGHITVMITDKNFKDFMYRYVKTNKGLIQITSDNKDLFINKTVKMRSPMYCIGTGKDKCLCSKCAGEFYYKLGKRNIGLAGTKISGTITQTNLQKFHENLVKTQQININDLLI